MDKELFRKTEGRLYRFFKDMKKIRNINLEIQELELQKESIRKDIQDVNVNLETGLNMGISYGEKVQTSSSGTCYAEKEIIKQIEKLEKEWVYIRKKILKKKAKIRELERDNANLRYNINDLGEEEKRFIEWKYGEGKSVDWIAVEMFGGARTTAYRKREEIIESIVQWSNVKNFWYKNGTKMARKREINKLI